ncbi:MAG TPA: hypothetical protein DDX89_08250 [Candidatus Omnitrophica bacterium]|nr:MAG: hypothetical protein A2Z92_01850 [Omnitrophica WOR_2 bacterium GWA2_63_20]OGX17253.1 MAG: hypothetical protein A2105_06850 [Omnitrophica WOR_2 bacterium GWF2_63_9]OGX31306.1 MAG: hypothetical protein A3E56_00135 [Omnitrophica WOR_2 bacterium RIFCSPHIGHO2_12_FULL_64_13]OGX36953.1 MAG: hypothetical protein A3B73_01440 [Omnitrophica WOR_2 bacterium RIFCSPHIGHO2_02_FULL_63_39]OGX46440.1 MAG: hypothetical protein A3I71_03105 [Omnitrophica WOR_2 bacterium RIFCSPLOWO2_02_FULL_63_16]OGX49807.1
MNFSNQQSAISNQQWGGGWAILLGLLGVTGFVKVAAATMVWRSAYAAGRQAVQIHSVENDTQWLQTDVVALQAPRHLAKVMANERSPFTARVELPAALGHTQVAQAADD